MATKISHNIEISVSTKYWEEHSKPNENLFFFVYFITIENKSDFTVQLIKRHWDIVDGNGEHRVVNGDGVVGETPIIEPGETYTYNSGCNLSSEIGKMSGYYTMKKLIDNTDFQVVIPKFDLILPAKLN